MVSNSPERLLSHGLWFEGTLEDYRSARLLYHHVNATGGPSDLVIEAVNLGDRMGRFHLIAGKGGPSRDESWAGHRGAREFLGHRAAGIGWIAPVPPGQAVPVFVQHITAGATASGILEIRALVPGDYSLRCYLSAPRSSWLQLERDDDHRDVDHGRLPGDREPQRVQGAADERAGAGDQAGVHRFAARQAPKVSRLWGKAALSL